jgi:hypothetical protein
LHSCPFLALSALDTQLQFARPRHGPGIRRKTRYLYAYEVSVRFDVAQVPPFAIDDDDQSGHLHSTNTQLWAQPFNISAAQFLNKKPLHGLFQRANLAVRIAFQSLFFQPPEGGLHHTLNGLLGMVNRLYHHFSNAEDASALTAVPQGCGGHKSPNTSNDGCILTVAHHTDSRHNISFILSPDASTVQVHSLLSLYISFVPAYLQLLQHEIKALALPFKTPNVPPPRPAPEPYPTGPHQSSFAYPAARFLAIDPYSTSFASRKRANNKPPPRPAPQPYPTGPHQSSVKQPNQPPPRPAPKPYSTGPHQS